MLTCPEPKTAPWLWPWGTKRDEKGQVTLSNGRTLAEYAAQYGTPVQLFNLDDFASRAQTITTAMAEEFWPGYGMNGAEVYYAAKAFLSPGLGKALADADMGIDTASLGELTCALHPSMGISPAKIGLHGNNKSREALLLALESGIGRIIVDSLMEIEQIETLAASLNKVAPVMVRVTTGVHAGGHTYIATAHEDQKFGLSLASGDAREALLLIAGCKHLKLVGLHSHIGSQIHDLDSFKEAAQRILKLRAWALSQGWEVPEVDLGGGWAISYTGEKVPSASQYARTLADVVRLTCQELGVSVPRISIEPGRWLAGPVGLTLYTVGTIKDVQLEGGGQRRYVSVDGGMGENIRPALYGSQYVATLANRLSSAPLVDCRVVGQHCESGDILLPSIALPADLHPGDILVVPATGAYGRVMASNYNWIPRPGVLGISTADDVWLVRPESIADLMHLVFPR